MERLRGLGKGQSRYSSGSDVFGCDATLTRESEVGIGLSVVFAPFLADGVLIVEDGPGMRNFRIELSAIVRRVEKRFS